MERRGNGPLPNPQRRGGARCSEASGSEGPSVNALALRAPAATSLAWAVKAWPLFAAILRAGCNATSQIAAAVTGGIAGGATGSPAIGFAVAVATDAGANYVIRYFGRARQGAEQDAIAQV